MTMPTNITCVKIPYKGIETTVFLIRTSEGAVLFDAASYDEDITNYVLPWLTAQGVAYEEITDVFISHKHPDHAGGLPALLRALPHLRVVTQSTALQEQYGDARVWLAQDDEMLCGCLRVVAIPGHTVDSAALLDTRTGTLICGDCLQLHGIFGQGKWGANIPFPAAHRRAITRLRAVPMETVLMAHEYYPVGDICCGKAEIATALDACIAPLDRIEALITAHPTWDDEAVCALYNEAPMTPTLGAHVVRAVRRDMKI